MRGWLAVNVFLLLMIGVACGLLFLSFKTIQLMGVTAELEHLLMAAFAVGSLIVTGTIGRALLDLLEKRSRAQ